MSDELTLEQRLEITEGWEKPLREAFVAADGNEDRQSEILCSIVALAMVLADKVGVRIEDAVAEVRAANCLLCKGQRWIRVHGPAAALLSGNSQCQEARGPCPECNREGRFEQKPTDWDVVPVVHSAVQVIDAAKVGQA